MFAIFGRKQREHMIFSPQPQQLPPVLDRLRGLPVRHLVRMLAEWEHVRHNGTASDRLRALVQMRRIVSALDAALV